LVDDERDIVNTIKRWLQADGFRVFGFADPLQALEYFRSNYDKIDLVLSDLRMRKIDGYGLIKRIKAIRPETKVVIMTALETNLKELSTMLPSINIDGLFSKPGSLERLVSDIKKIILY
jgi:DNA-binding NtrC family response regulator